MGQRRFRTGTQLCDTAMVHACHRLSSDPESVQHQQWVSANDVSMLPF